MQARNLHCVTSKSSLWDMGYVAHGGAFERPRIVQIHTYVFGQPSRLTVGMGLEKPKGT